MGANESTIYSAVIISYVIVGTIIAYFVVSIIRHQRRNLELHRRNILAEITTLEQERTRMSSDLHDELGPLLSVIKFELQSIDSTNEEDTEQLEQAVERIDDVIARLRTIARNLMPSALTRKGLITALEEFISATNRAGVLDIKFSYQVTRPLRSENSINLYRIVQEIIQNTIKHASATQLIIQVKEAPRELAILTRDNGKGFNYNAAKEQSSGLGLRNIKSRAEILGGKLYVESAPGAGTQFLIKVPMEQAAEISL